MRRLKNPTLIAPTARSLPAILLAAMALAGCPANKGLPTITLTANQTTVTIGQETANGMPLPITLTATGTDSGAPWVDASVTVQFTTDWGNFDPPSDMDSSDNQSVQDQISGHGATQLLYLDATPPAGNVATVTATYIDTAGDKAVASVKINVMTGGVAASLTFNCLSGNIGAFANQNTTMEIGCTAQAYDAGGHQVTGVPLSFMAEAGAIQYDSEYDTYAYFPFRSGPGNVLGNQPLDVMPLTGEPSYVDGMGKTRNPRDGLVTMIAYAPSDATNSGGLQGEPYVDIADSGSYQPGDPYVDLNGNGTWDASQTSTIWVQTKILWTGSVQNPSPIMQYDPTFNGTDVGDGVELGYPDTGTLAWPLVDQNLNIIAANNATTDGVNWDCSPEPNVDPLTATTPLNSTDSLRFGMLMDGFGNLTDPGDSTSWGIGGTVSLTVLNNSPCPSTTPASAVTFTCYGTINRTLWLDEQGEPQGEINETTQTVVGSADPNTSASCSSD